MKRLAFVAAVLAITACSKSENAAKDTSNARDGPAPPAAAAAPDTGMKMDTTHEDEMDTTKKDTTKKKP